MHQSMTAGVCTIPIGWRVIIDVACDFAKVSSSSYSAVQWFHRVLISFSSGFRPPRIRQSMQCAMQPRSPETLYVLSFHRKSKIKLFPPQIHLCHSWSSSTVYYPSVGRTATDACWTCAKDNLKHQKLMVNVCVCRGYTSTFIRKKHFPQFCQKKLVYFFNFHGSREERAEKVNKKKNSTKNNRTNECCVHMHTQTTHALAHTHIHTPRPISIGNKVGTNDSCALPNIKCMHKRTQSSTLSYLFSQNMLSISPATRRSSSPLGSGHRFILVPCSLFLFHSSFTFIHFTYILAIFLLLSLCILYYAIPSPCWLHGICTIRARNM